MYLVTNCEYKNISCKMCFTNTTLLIPGWNPHGLAGDKEKPNEEKRVKKNR